MRDSTAVIELTMNRRSRRAARASDPSLRGPSLAPTQVECPRAAWTHRPSVTAGDPRAPKRVGQARCVARQADHRFGRTRRVVAAHGAALHSRRAKTIRAPRLPRSVHRECRSRGSRGGTMGGRERARRERTERASALLLRSSRNRACRACPRACDRRESDQHSGTGTERAGPKTPRNLREAE